MEGFPGVAWLDALSKRRTSARQVSGLVMLLVLGLSIMPLANGFAEIGRALKRQ